MKVRSSSLVESAGGQPCVTFRALLSQFLRSYFALTLGVPMFVNGVNQAARLEL